MDVVKRLASIRSVLPEVLDAFICSASFEGRSLSVPQMIARDSALDGPILVASNNLHIPSVGGNETAILQGFSNVIQCHLDSDDPLTTADRLSRDLQRLLDPTRKSGFRLGLDVTTFTRESLLILLRCLIDVLTPHDTLIGFYNRAESYEGSVGAGDQWLSRGVREIRSVLGYPGDLRPTRRNHLVMLAGFEDDRALQITTDLEPSVLSLGTPDPKSGHAYVHDEKMQQRRARWLSYLGCRVHEFFFDGYDLENCVVSIAQAVKAEPSMNTILSAMNTKISTLAAGVYALTNPDVQLTYAQADVYNVEGYSVAGEEVYVFDCSDTIRGLLPTSSST